LAQRTACCLNNANQSGELLSAIRSCHAKRTLRYKPLYLGISTHYYFVHNGDYLLNINLGKDAQKPLWLIPPSANRLYTIFQKNIRNASIYLEPSESFYYQVYRALKRSERDSREQVASSLRNLVFKISWRD